LKILALVTLFAYQVVAQQLTVGSVNQDATCAVAGVQGNVTVTCGAGVPPSTVALLNKQFAAQLKERDLRIADLSKEINEWKDRFDKLIERLGEPGIDEKLRHEAEESLKAGKLGNLCAGA
jgi:Tat protein secretion system quality control protein TatD with DNase activity